MHYDSYGNGVFRNPAMVKLDGSIIEPNKKMSDLDIVTLNKMYPCEDSCDQTNVQGKTNCHNQLHGQRIMEEIAYLKAIRKTVYLIFFQAKICYPK